MNEKVEKPKNKKSKAVANSVTQGKSMGMQSLGFVDNRPEALVQRKLSEAAKNAPKDSQQRTIENKYPKPQKADTLQTKRQSTESPIQKVAVSNANMTILFPGGKNGKEWFFWGPGGYHVGAIRENDGSGDVNVFHVKKEFPGAKTNRIDWTASGDSYDEVAPPTILEHDNEEALSTMRELGEETSALLTKWKKE